MSLTPEQITAKNFQKFYEGILPYLGGSVHTGFTPIGTIIAVMGKTAPTNYLACNGQVVNIAKYPELASYFETQFGTKNHFGGNGTTTFGIPDLRGEFLRGTGTNSHTNQGSGANVGTHQDATEMPRFVTNQAQAAPKIYGCTNGTSGTNDISNPDSSTIGVGYNRTTSNATDFVSDTAGIGSFTSRPTNTSVLYCIATKNIFMDAGNNYSTEEQVVGTWIDGKPIYQKTISCGVLPDKTTKTVAHNISNIDIITSLQGFAIRNTSTSGSTAYMISLQHADYDEGNNVRLTANKTNIIITTDLKNGWSTNFTTSYVTIQYTKTTD